jgi:hypothetical protein
MGEKIKPLTVSEMTKLTSIIEAGFAIDDAMLTAADRKKHAVSGIFEMLGSLTPVEEVYDRIRVPFVDGSIAMEAERNPTVNYDKPVGSTKVIKQSPYGGARSAAQTRWNRHCDAIPTVCADLVPKGAKFVKPERAQNEATKKGDTPEKKAQRELSRVQTDARKNRQAEAIKVRKQIVDLVALLAKACYTAGNADDIKLYNKTLKSLQSVVKMMQTKTQSLQNDSPEKAA